MNFILPFYAFINLSKAYFLYFFLDMEMTHLKLWDLQRNTFLLFPQNGFFNSKQVSTSFYLGIIYFSFSSTLFVNGKETYQVLYKCHPLIYRHLQQATHHNLQQDMLVAFTSPIFLRQICQVIHNINNDVKQPAININQIIKCFSFLKAHRYKTI